MVDTCCVRSIHFGDFGEFTGREIHFVEHKWYRGCVEHHVGDNYIAFGILADIVEGEISHLGVTFAVGQKKRAHKFACLTIVTVKIELSRSTVLRAPCQIDDTIDRHHCTTERTVVFKTHIRIRRLAGTHP